MSLLTMFAPPSLASRLDIPRCTKMALVHDMAESLVGDITPVDAVSKPEKNRREATTMDYLTADLLGNVDGGAAGRDLRQVWEEYETGETLESKFVHDIDKMELLLQMTEYERATKCEVDLSEFAYVAKKIVLPEVQAWCAEVLKEREELWRELGKQPAALDSKVVEGRQDEYYRHQG
jgi:putative hydrolase of HD superfamily